MDNVVRIRWWINDHAVTVTVLSVILLVICFGAMLQQYRPPTHSPQITSVWFFDQVTGTIFEAHSDAIPPIATTEYPDQPEPVEAGVRLYDMSVFALAGEARPRRVLCRSGRTNGHGGESLGR